MKKFFGIIGGLAISAFGVVAFVLPNDILVGGATGLGRVAYYYAGMPISATIAAVNIVMFIIGLAIMGKKFAATIVVSTFAYPLLIDFYGRIPGITNLTDDKMIAAIFGGVLLGAGIGFVIRLGASTGGTDIPPIILNYKFGIPVGITMYAIDFAVLLTQVPFAKMEDILLGILMTMICSIVINKVMMAGSGDTQVMIISNEFDKIQDKLNEMIIGVTVLYGRTGYLGKDQEVLMCIVPGRELNRVKEAIQLIDPKAFMTISSIREVSGLGFSFGRRNVKKLRQERKAEM